MNDERQASVTGYAGQMQAATQGRAERRALGDDRLCRQVSAVLFTWQRLSLSEAAAFTSVKAQWSTNNALAKRGEIPPNPKARRGRQSVSAAKQDRLFIPRWDKLLNWW